MSQVKNSFDKKTIKKIIRGALIAGTGAVGLFILNSMGQLQISNPILVSFLAWAIPVATNAIREWTKGK